MSTEPEREPDAALDPAHEPMSVVDAEQVGGAGFWIGFVFGWAVIIGGIRLAMHDREVKPMLLLKWLAGGLILHDAVWLPLLALSTAVAMIVARRRVSALVAWAAMTSAVLALIAWPFVRGYGRRADVPSALQRNYAHGLIEYVGVTWLIALVGLAVDAFRRRRRPVVR